MKPGRCTGEPEASEAWPLPAEDEAIELEAFRCGPGAGKSSEQNAVCWEID